MNKNILTVVLAAAALVLCGAGWLLLPWLQDPQRTLDAETSEQLERARRLLDRYDAGLTFKTLLDDQLADEGIEIETDDVAEALADDYQQVHASLWDTHRPTNWPDGSPRPRPANADYGNLPDQIEDGLDRQAELVERNDELLDEALSAVDDALSLSHGDASSQADAEANRLKAIILYQMGMATSLEAQLYRRTGARYRRELVVMAGGAEAPSEHDLVAESGIDEQISSLEAKAAQLNGSIGEARESLTTLDQEIETRKSRISEAEARRDEADRAMRQLKSNGVDFSDPRGAERYGSRLEELGRAFRQASREVQGLRTGTYPNAEIDHTGDYITGQYVEKGSATGLTVEYGLRHYQDQRAVLASQIEAQQQAADACASDIDRLRGIENAYRAAQDRAKERVSKSVADAGEMYTLLSRIDSEALTIEDDALELFAQSARSGKQASDSAGNWVSEAQRRTMGLSPEAQDRSAFGSRARDGWMGGYAAAQEADAHLARAWVYYDRYRVYTENAEVTASTAQRLHLKEADADAERTKAQEAHDAGVEAITRAVAVLEGAHRKSERHWTITAQAAGATYLLALFGHEEYLEDTIEAYRAAVKGRENQDYTRDYMALLERLEQP